MREAMMCRQHKSEMPIYANPISATARNPDPLATELAGALFPRCLGR